MEILGYHGTDENCVNSIIKNGYEFSGPNHWLGSGIYFFGNLKELNFSGQQEARDWAVKVKKVKSYGIFEALIDSDNYIDIAANPMHKEIFESIRQEALDKHIESGKLIKDFKETTIFVKLEQKLNVDFIVAVTDGAKNPKFPSYLVRRIQIQICVKNKSCIKKNDLIAHGVANG